MRKLTAFNFITLNGFFKGPHDDISWHKHGEEEGEYSIEAMKADNILLFGRITYEMMEGYWSTQQAMTNDPVVAEAMNSSEKIVFSNTLKKAGWNNTSLVSGDIIDAVRKMKQTPGKDLTILGSGTIVSQFAEAGLIDEYEIMVDPVVIADGTPMFKGIKQELNLQLTGTRVFKSGVVLLRYSNGERTENMR